AVRGGGLIADIVAGGPNQLRRAGRWRWETKDVRTGQRTGHIGRRTAVDQQIRSIHSGHGFAEHDFHLRQTLHGDTRERIERGDGRRSRVEETVLPGRTWAGCVERIRRRGKISNGRTRVPGTLHRTGRGLIDREWV